MPVVHEGFAQEKNAAVCLRWRSRRRSSRRQRPALLDSAAAPKTVLKKVGKEGADEPKAALEGAGASVTVK